MTRQPVADDPPARGSPWPLPQLELGIIPTPLQPMSGLASAFGGGPELLVKREDLCGVALGGNKLRKLLAILAEAVARRATVVVTTGAPQSNHAAMTAVAAAMHGIRVELHLTGPEPARRTGNLLIAGLAGASATFLGECGERERDAQIARRIDELRAAGEMPYLIPLGGSTPLGGPLRGPNRDGRRWMGGSSDGVPARDASAAACRG